MDTFPNSPPVGKYLPLLARRFADLLEPTVWFIMIVCHQRLNGKEGILVLAPFVLDMSLHLQ